ncbi:S-adenosyl-L-methionine-dependent methyltransferase [Coprinopsis sp. MPI-PUGE-AT-0042]|nr:S-adenosyl-L-methionine-dependent methyltransferase [Coprinopsis sp. MPI-PUGE-AT-0042]
MKLSNACTLLQDLWEAMKIAFFPSLQQVLGQPSLVLRPRALAQTFMAKVWEGGMAQATDEGGKAVKQGLITPNAHGVVLDVGAGHGHTIRYLDRPRVTKYVAVEPNTRMHSYIRAEAHLYNFHESDGTLVILSCGAEDSLAILSSLSNTQVDTIISVLVLCSIPSPAAAIKSLVRDVLKSGGQFLFYEHVLSHREDVAWWQKFWTPLWSRAFDGCCLDRASHLIIQDLKDEEHGERAFGRTESCGKRQEILRRTSFGIRSVNLSRSSGG